MIAASPLDLHLYLCICLCVRNSFICEDYHSSCGILGMFFFVCVGLADDGSRCLYLFLFMWFDAFDDALKIMIVRDWCGPHDYLAMVATTKIWSCAFFLRNAACFAVSRMHVPGLESSFAMAHWNLVWKECVEVFHARNWSAALWKDCCKFQKGDFLLVPQSPFFKGLNLMVATHIVDDAVASILAVTIDNVGIRSIDALLMLQSGKFAFFGCVDYVNFRWTELLLAKCL